MIVAKVTPAEYNQLVEKLTEEGVGLELRGSGETGGTFCHEGVTIQFTYDGQSRLVLTIVKKPFLVATSLCESKIRSALQEAGVSCA